MEPSSFEPSPPLTSQWVRMNELLKFVYVSKSSKSIRPAAHGDNFTEKHVPIAYN